MISSKKTTDIIEKIRQEASDAEHAFAIGHESAASYEVRLAALLDELRELLPSHIRDGALYKRIVNFLTKRPFGWEKGLPTALDLLKTQVEDFTKKQSPKIEEPIPPGVAKMLQEWVEKNPVHAKPIEFFLHDRIRQASYAQFKNGHYRDSALNAVLALNDILKEKLGDIAEDKDGAALARHAFSTKNPLLLTAGLGTKSGEAKQEGLGSMIAGLMLWLRNPNAHPLKDQVTSTKAARVLLFASLLAEEIHKSDRVD